MQIGVCFGLRLLDDVMRNELLHIYYWWALKSCYIDCNVASILEQSQMDGWIRSLVSRVLCLDQDLRLL